MRPLALTDLPNDLLLLISINIDSKDLLSFIQTCRVLHTALATSDYVWHHIKHRVPLDLAKESVMSLTAAEVKGRVLNALRLNANWERKESKIGRIRKAQFRNSVMQMQPLGPNWLVTLSRSSTSSTIYLSLWRITGNLDRPLKDDAASLVARFEPLHAFKFAASLHEQGDSALVAVLGALTSQKGRLLTVYQLNLNVPADDAGTATYLINQWQVENSGVFYHAEICGALVAAAVVHVSQASHGHQIVLFNTATGSTVLVDSPTLLSQFDCGRLQFKIYPQHIVLVGIHNDQLKVHVRELPREIFSGGSSTVQEFPTHIIDYETSKIRNIEIYATSEPAYQTTPETFSVMAAHSPFSTMEKGIVRVYHFPIDISSRNENAAAWRPAFTFNTPANVTLEPTCLGKTGQRAVWLEHQWNTDEYRLMKGSFPTMGNAKVVPLQPADVALPFEPHSCRSLAFEEAAGRLWIGVNTGEVYILEF